MSKEARGHLAALQEKFVREKKERADVLPSSCRVFCTQDTSVEDDGVSQCFRRCLPPLLWMVTGWFRVRRPRVLQLSDVDRSQPRSGPPPSFGAMTRACLRPPAAPRLGVLVAVAGVLTGATKAQNAKIAGKFDGHLRLTEGLNVTSSGEAKGVRARAS